MRTTLTIDDDVLAVARGMARQQGVSVGEAVSELARRALRPAPAPASRNGVPLLPTRDGQVKVTLEIVNALRDELA